MCTPISPETFDETMDNELKDVGKSLEKLPSSTDELFTLLETVEKVLRRVWQKPPESTLKAVEPSIKALANEKLLRHTDFDIQIVLASCLMEITRITAPDAPYEDDQMKEVFQLFLIAMKQIYLRFGAHYVRGLRVLQAMARLRFCVIMLDAEWDMMVVEMVQLFFDTVKVHHTNLIRNNMEIVMTIVIEECDNISMELLRPILDNTRMANKDVSPIAWELGKTVVEKCATRLQPHLKEAVKSMNLNVHDFPEIISALCKEATSEENTVVEKVTANIPSIISPSGDGTSNVAASTDGANNVAASSKSEKMNVTSDVNTHSTTVGPSSDGATTVAADSESEGVKITNDGATNVAADSESEEVKITSDGPTNVAADSESEEMKITSDGATNVAADSESEEVKITSDGTTNVAADSESEEVKITSDVNIQSTTVGPLSDGATNVAADSKSEEVKLASDVDEANPNNLVDENSVETLKFCEQIVQLKNDDARPDSANNAETGHQTNMHNGIVLGKRGRKPNTWRGLEEGYAHIWAMEDSGSYRRPRNKNKKEKKDSPLPSEHGKEKLPSDSSRKEVDSVSEGSISKVEQSKNKKSSVKQHGDKEISSKQRKKSVKSKVKERGLIRSKKGTKGIGSSAGSVQKGEGSLHVIDLEEKVEVLLQEPGEGKEIKDGDTSQMESPVSKPVKDKNPGKGEPEKERKSTRSGTDYGEELVNSRIMVWWPMDKTFYTGSVAGYDPATKMHKIVYDDDEQEVLDLQHERWEMFNEEQPRLVHPSQTTEIDVSSPPVKALKKTTKKRTAGSSKNNTASSKRSKIEEPSAKKDDSDDETSESYFS